MSTVGSGLQLCTLLVSPDRFLLLAASGNIAKVFPTIVTGLNYHPSPSYSLFLGLCGVQRIWYEKVNLRHLLLVLYKEFRHRKQRRWFNGKSRVSNGCCFDCRFDLYVDAITFRLDVWHRPHLHLPFGFISLFILRLINSVPCICHAFPAQKCRVWNTESKQSNDSGHAVHWNWPCS